MPIPTNIKKLKESVIRSIERVVCDALNHGLVERYLLSDPDDDGKIKIDIRYKDDHDRVLITIDEIKKNE